MRLAGRRKLIVGIDPGTTSAFAAIDFSRNVVRLWSKRDPGGGELVATLREAGSPAMIAADVATPPDSVLKIASAFNARLFTPPRDMSEAEKANLSLGKGVSNAHERDALAAAFKAFNSVANVLRKVGRTLRERGMPEKIEEAQALVLGGVRLEDALEMFAPPQQVPAAGVSEQKPLDPGRVQAEFAKREERIRELLVALAELRKMNERLEAEKRELNQRIMSLLKGAMDRVLADTDVRRSRAEAERAKAFARSLQADIRRLKGLSALKRRSEKKSLDIEAIIGEHRAANRPRK